jgi:hypothetical protein
VGSMQSTGGRALAGFEGRRAWFREGAPLP